MANETGVLLQERRAGAAPSTGIHSRFVVAGGIKTHFLEAGSGFPVVLLHSGEFGGCAELSWEYTIGSLAERFRVIAADWAGFGKTEKVFSFDDTWGFRIRHMTASIQILGLESAHFIGNSMGGTLLLQALASKPAHGRSKRRSSFLAVAASLKMLRAKPSTVMTALWITCGASSKRCLYIRRCGLTPLTSSGAMNFRCSWERGNRVQQRVFARHGV